MDELVENLHRNELTPAQKAAHQLTYAGLIKKADKVQAADDRRKEKQKAIESAKKTGDPLVEGHRFNNNKPMITEKLATDTGVDKEAVRRRHITGQKLATRLGVNVGSLEKATADELLEAGEAVTIAAQEKIEKSAEVRTSYRNAQDTAQAEKVGLWQDPAPMPPWEWRKGDKERSRRHRMRFDEVCRCPDSREISSKIAGNPAHSRMNSLRRFVELGDRYGGSREIIACSRLL